MNQGLSEEKCTVFTEKPASSAPVPGGGAAALIGARAAAIGRSLVVGRPPHLDRNE